MDAEETKPRFPSTPTALGSRQRRDPTFSPHDYVSIGKEAWRRIASLPFQAHSWMRKSPARRCVSDAKFIRNARLETHYF